MKFIDYSIGSTYACCHEKARLSYDLHLQPLVVEAPLAFGHAIHAGIHAKYLALAKGGGLRDSEEAAIAAYYHDLKQQNADLPLAIDNPDERRSVERGENILRAYIFKWKDEQVVPFVGAGGEPYVEIGFSIYLMDHGGEPVLLVGRMDRIMRSLMDHSLYVTDTKTTSSSIYSVERSVRPNHQASIYYHAAEQILGEPIAGVIFDAIYVSDRQPAKKGNEWQLLGVDIDKDFGRFPTMRSEIDIEEALADMREVATNYFDDLQAVHDGRRKRLHRNAPAACTMYGKCKYNEVCSTNLNPTIIANQFVVRPWQPFEGLVNVKEIGR